MSKAKQYLMYNIVPPVGVLTIWVAANRGREISQASFVVPLGTTQEARVRLRFGAGRLVVGSGAGAGNLIEVEASTEDSINQYGI